MKPAFSARFAPASLAVGSPGTDEKYCQAHPTWHEGELYMQRQTGVSERMDKVGRAVVYDHLTEQHRRFYPLLPMVVLGAVDPAGDIWATLRTGEPGFLHSSDSTRLHIDTSHDESDPAEAGLIDGRGVGLIGIELSTHRRNRLNGIVVRRGINGFDLVVEHSFGDCPQYIQMRSFKFVECSSRTPSTASARFQELDERARRMISSADTFFVASYVDRDDGRRQVDVSHRGGRPGFIRLDDKGVLTVPDFAGNLFFSTLGNFVVNPRAGVVFVDFSSGSLLQMTGKTEVLLDSPEIVALQGAERLWRFTPTTIVYRALALPIRWQSIPNEESPSSLMTGTWHEA